MYFDPRLGQENGGFSTWKSIILCHNVENLFWKILILLVTLIKAQLLCFYVLFVQLLQKLCHFDHLLRVKTGYFVPGSPLFFSVSIRNIF